MGDYQPKWVLHVGPPKTGSTAIQWKMQEYRRELESSGILFPITGWQGSGHHGVSEILRLGGPLPEELMKEAEGSGCHTVFLSSERFFGYIVSGEIDLASLPKGTVLISGIRSLPGWVASLWQESLKHGWSRWIDQSIDEFSSNHWISNAALYRACDKHDIHLRVMNATHFDVTEALESLFKLNLPREPVRLNQSETCEQTFQRWAENTRFWEWREVNQENDSHALASSDLAPIMALVGRAAQQKLLLENNKFVEEELRFLNVKGVLGSNDVQELEEQARLEIDSARELFSHVRMLAMFKRLIAIH